MAAGILSWRADISIEHRAMLPAAAADPWDPPRVDPRSLSVFRSYLV
jgi:hypothetical protein